jgi:putative DNA primase/helicase
MSTDCRTAADCRAPRPVRIGLDPRYELTDLGNAERLASTNPLVGYGDDLRHVPAWGWLAWDGKHWQRKAEVHAYQALLTIVRDMYTEAAAETDRKRKAALVKHAMASEQEPRLRAALKIAANLPTIAASPETFDQAPLLLNVENGTLDLRTGEMREPRRVDNLTHSLPVKYDAEARCDRWLRFLGEIMDGDEELVAFLQRAVGYSLTGDTREQCYFLCHGRGANGKTTLLETLRMLFSGLAQHADFSTFLARRSDGPRNDIARLRGARLVTASEADGERRLAEVLIKQVTGGDTLSARFLHREFFEFVPTFKLWLAANHRPVIRGTDCATWRRIRLIPFEVTFPPERQDRKLTNKLRAELPGILAWAVRGCLAWQAEGLGVPGAVASATEQYRLEMDDLGPFLDECCVVGDSYRVRSRDLRRAYVAWCERSGERPLSARAFALRLQETPDGPRPIKSNGCRWWVRIGLVAEVREATA